MTRREGVSTAIVGVSLLIIAFSVIFLVFLLNLVASSKTITEYTAYMLGIIISVIMFLSGIALLRDYIYSSLSSR